MENLTLQENDALLQLCSLTGLSTIEITERVITSLDAFGFIVKDIEDCGKSIFSISRVQEVGVYYLAVDFFNGIFVSDEITEFTGALVLWGDGDHPCPECGSEIDFFHDGTDGITWTEQTCSNPNCNYATTDEPDHDTMRGGYDYDKEF